MVVFEGKNLHLLAKSGFLIFSDFSFSLQKGEICLLLGPNGIGKSSFYESIIGLHSVEKGEFFLNNFSINSLKPSERVRAGIKYISQSTALFDHATVLDNLEIAAEYLLPKKERKEAIDNAIETFFLKKIKNKKTKNLSGGQKRRVDLAKILIGKADLIIMDEPFAAIDQGMIDKISNIILSLKEQGKSFIITDHNIDAIKKIGDFAITVGDGKTSIQKM